jgi:hypothetical protein
MVAGELSESRPVNYRNDGRSESESARWGMPSSKNAHYQAALKRADKLCVKGKDVDLNDLLRFEPDGGTTNVRNTSSADWKPWLRIANCCLVPFTSFSEFDHISKQYIWAALGEDLPTALFFPAYGRCNGLRSARSRAEPRRSTSTPSSQRILRRGRCHPPQGDAVDPHHARGVRGVAHEALGAAEGAPETVARRSAAGRARGAKKDIEVGG